jgi:hypothetical protein
MDQILNDDTLQQIVHKAENKQLSSHNKFPFIQELVNILETSENDIRTMIKAKCDINGDKQILFKFIMLYYGILIQNPDISRDEIVKTMNNIIADSDLRLAFVKLKLVNG